MRRLLSVLLLLATVTGCPKPPPPPPRVVPEADVALRAAGKGFRKKPGSLATAEQEAVYAVLEADANAYKEATAGVPATAPPSAVSAALTKYADALDKIDLEKCPPQVAAPFRKYRQAYRELQRAVAPLPDAYKRTDFNDALAGLFQGEKGKGKALGGDVMHAVDAAEDARSKLYEAANLFGVEADR